VGDITCVHTQQGWLYLAVVIDLFSRKVVGWGNAVSESFFHTLKTELTNHVKFKSIEEAKQAIFEYIEVFYNRVRIHSTNDYLSPVEHERAHDF